MEPPQAAQTLESDMASRQGTLRPVSEPRELRLLSVVTPMYFEEGAARVFYERVVEACGDMPLEIVVTNDGSTDRTGEILAEIAEADPRVKVITLSRNFGHQAALSAGLDHATGDAVVMIDADLQDPPELIPRDGRGLEARQRRRLRRARVRAPVRAARS